MSWPHIHRPHVHWTWESVTPALAWVIIIACLYALVALEPGAAVAEALVAVILALIALVKVRSGPEPAV